MLIYCIQRTIDLSTSRADSARSSQTSLNPSQATENVVNGSRSLSLDDTEKHKADTEYLLHAIDNLEAIVISDFISGIIQAPIS